MRVCNRCRLYDLFPSPSVHHCLCSQICIFHHNLRIVVSTSSSFYGVFSDRRVVVPLCDRWFYSSPSTFSRDVNFGRDSTSSNTGGMGFFWCNSLLLDFVHLCVGPWPGFCISTQGLRLLHRFALCARVFTHFSLTLFLHHMITKQGVRAFVLIFLFLPHTEGRKYYHTSRRGGLRGEWMDWITRLS